MSALMCMAAVCSEQLELVEDKLRDFRTLSDDDGDDKVRHGHPEMPVPVQAACCLCHAQQLIQRPTNGQLCTFQAAAGPSQLVLSAAGCRRWL